MEIPRQIRNSKYQVISSLGKGNKVWLHCAFLYGMCIMVVCILTYKYLRMKPLGSKRKMPEYCSAKYFLIEKWIFKVFHDNGKY